MKLLRGYYFKWESVTKLFGIHRATLLRRIKNYGERIIVGILRAKRVSVQRWKVRESIHCVDPINATIRWILKHPRRIYSVPSPNSLWHNDGLHKLIHWKFVIHVCIDGFSRMVTCVVCASDNRTETAFKAFLSGAKVFGLQARVRGDYGTENVAIAEYM